MNDPFEGLDPAVRKVSRCTARYVSNPFADEGHRPTVARGSVHRTGQVADDPGESLLAGSRDGLRVLARGNVDDRAVEPFHRTLCVAHALRPLVNPADRSVRVNDPVFLVKHLAAQQPFGQRFQRILVFGVDDRGQAAHPVVDEIRCRIAAQHLDTVAHMLHRPTGNRPAAVDRAGHVRHHQSELCLAFARRGFRLLSRRNIDNGAVQPLQSALRVEHALRPLEDPALRAVGASDSVFAFELVAGLDPFEQVIERIEVALDQKRVKAAHLVFDEIGCRVAGEFLDALAHVLHRPAIDRPASINSARHVLHHQAELPLGFFSRPDRLDQRVLRLSPRRDVEQHAVDPAGVAGAVQNYPAAIVQPAHGAVRMDDPVLRDVGIVRRIDARAHIAVEVVRMDDLLEPLAFRAKEFGGRISRQLFDGVAQEDVGPTFVGQTAIDCARHVVDHGAELFLARRERRLRLLLGGYIDQDAVDPADFIVVVHAAVAVLDPPHAAVAVDDPVFPRIGLSRNRGVVIDLHIVGMDDIGKAPHRMVDEVGGRVAAQLLDPVAEIDIGPGFVGPAAIDGSGLVFRQAAEQRFARFQALVHLAEFLVRLDTVRDILDERDVNRRVFLSHVLQVNGHVVDRAVLAAVTAVEADRPLFSVAQGRQQPAHVVGGIPRHDVGRGHLAHFVRAVLQVRECARVDFDKAQALGVDDVNFVQRILDDPPQPVALGLRLEAFGDILDECDENRWRFLRHELEAHRNRIGRSVLAPVNRLKTDLVLRPRVQGGDQSRKFFARVFGLQIERRQFLELRRAVTQVRLRPRIHLDEVQGLGIEDVDFVQ